MAGMEVVQERDAGSRFALNYNQHTTAELFRYAGARKLFERELRHCTESEYWNHYQESMNMAEGSGRRRLYSDIVIEEQSQLIVLDLSSGK